MNETNDKTENTISITQEDGTVVTAKLSDFKIKACMESLGHEAAPEGSLGHEAAPEGSLGHEAAGLTEQHEITLKMTLDSKSHLGKTIDGLLEFKKLIISK